MAKYDKTKASEYDGLIRRSADKHGVSYDLLRHLIFNESSFNNKAKSPTGPKGLGQFTAATGRAMGLNVYENEDNPNDDRYNPEKSLDASAKLLSGYVKKYSGDELKAALAYNVGEGKKGRPQLEAYDRGDFGAIGDEGRLYMQKLAGTANSQNTEKLLQFGGNKSGKAFEVTAPAPKVQLGAPGPEVANMNLDTSEVVTKQPQQTVSMDAQWKAQTGKTKSEYQEAQQEKQGAFYKTGAAVETEVKNSFVGTTVQATGEGFDVLKATFTPTKWNSHQFTNEELQKIRDSGLRSEYVGSVLGADTNSLDDLIELALERQSRADESADAGWGAHLVGGVAGAVIDPLSYVPIVGTANKGLSIGQRMLRVGAQSGALNVASEELRIGIGGGHTDYVMAAAGGFFFGAGLTGLTAKLFPREASKFAQQTQRMEARDAAMRGDIDNSAINTEGLTFRDTPSGAKYAEQEDGSIVLPDGQVLSDTNPVNAATASRFDEVDPEKTKGAWAVNLGSLSDISTVTARSQSEGVRGMAYDLTRSTTGYAEGGIGKQGTVASDTAERLTYSDTRDLPNIEQLVRDALKDPEWTLGAGRGSPEANREALVRRVVEAQEETMDVSKLTKTENDLREALFDFTARKEDAMANPAQFGNSKAIPVMNKTKLSGKYFPVSYVPEKVAILRQMFGGDVPQTQAFMKEHFLADYASNPNTKAMVDELIVAKNNLEGGAVTPELVDKWANDKAFGIVNGEFSASMMLEDIASASNSMNLGRNDFLESRHGFNMAFQSRLPDGTMFSLNDIRSFDANKLLRNYARRVNGDIALHSTGRTTQDYLDGIAKLREEARGTNNGQMKKEVDALEDTIKLITGRARRDGYTGAEMMLKSLGDLSFVAKNAYMGALNLTEIAGQVAKGNVRALLHGIPVVRDLAYATKPVSGTELKRLEFAMMGREVDNLIRPTRQDLIQTLRDNSGWGNTSSSILGTVKYATQEIAARWPMTKLLQGTTNYLLSSARQGLMGNLIEAAATGRSSRWLKDNFLKSASVTPEQAKGILQFLKDHAVTGPDGKWTFPNVKDMQMDPRAMDLWRLADKVADETMLRPNKINAQNVKQLGPLMNAAMQFKTFTTKSLNGKFLKTYYEATKNGRQIDAALTTGISTMMAGSFYVMQSHLKAASLPEHERNAYLQKALDPTMIAYAMVSRSSVTGAPLGIADTVLGPMGITPSAYMRSSILPKDVVERDRSKAMTAREVGGEFASGLLQQVPMANYAFNTAAAVYNAGATLGARGPKEATEFTTGVYNSVRELIPNDPLSQRLWLAAMEENIYSKAKPLWKER